MLTNAAAKAATPLSRAYKLADAGGLHLFVAPTGRKTWRLKYRFGGREKLLTIGAFPTVSIAEARGRRETAKEQLRAGLDPSVEGADLKRDDFDQLARAWYQHNLASWSPAHAADVMGSLERDVLPLIGEKPAGAIQPRELLQLLRQVEWRGNLVTAHRIRQRLSEIYAFGIAEGLVDEDPAAKLGAAMKDVPPATPQPALTSIDECKALLEASDGIAARPVTILASRFLALTAVRLAAVRLMRWSEVEDLDGAAPIWRVPAAHMKLRRSKKDEARFDHIVPLSAAAVAVLRQAARENGYDTRSSGADPALIGATPPVESLDGRPGGHPAVDPCAQRADSRGGGFRWGVADRANLHPHGANMQFGELNELVFPGRGGSAPIGEGAIGELYDRAGFAGRHVPHGWRASFSTILNEQLGEEWAVTIDRALAHSPKDKVEAAYNRAQLLERRRQVMVRWAELLLPR